MKINFDSSAFKREHEFAVNLPPRLKKRVWTQVRIVSFNAERLIKIRMPVDTGRARASWGHNTGAVAASGDSIWDENEKVLMLTQGSRVDYIEYLNEGSSKQAPAGFIDAVERQAAQQLTDLIDGEVKGLFDSP